MPDPPRIYWDACVLLSYVNGLPDRLPEIEALYEEARQKNIEIVTSTISITEVAYGAMEQTQGAVDPARDAKVESLWIPPSPIQVVEFYRLIAFRARALVRQGIIEQRKLKSMDAIHLSTAIQLEVQELHTYERDLKRWGPVVGFAIREPIATSPQLPTTGRSEASGGTSQTS